MTPTIIELIIIIISLLQWIRFIDFEKKVHRNIKKYTPFLVVINVLTYYHSSICTV
ncbi:DUF5079 family protein [Staphylococcus aureus]